LHIGIASILFLALANEILVPRANQINASKEWVLFVCDNSSEESSATCANPGAIMNVLVSWLVANLARVAFFCIAKVTLKHMKDYLPKGSISIIGSQIA